ncbi:PPOX class F420-dependent oxidoreductase [Cellulomonas shaoxiangyii]|uniref:PPOX class F420-dependent oxidoreductase n=1 Tax=Cellulomonas shaoxiangyii TaxID=2566013 RepID=A0A4P7SLI4_9CELL|nr:PPOX class F420-dependent oxidoreductase [Cellulomonas shaoxiangyii]QCB94801.1 PPOX class F420-dependent oxidoreductase [Cellulomonas shaoxiangyii]TGY86531.1 PPOX class F420-dependent oxidoreductase [Cellulomonas shaoxiangyii]
MFTEQELDYLRSQSLARLATVAPDRQPDVVPVAFEYDGQDFWVGGVDASVTRTRKFRNVSRGGQQVALVIDDLLSLDPFVARGIRVYGRAEGPLERTGMLGTGYFLRITPEESWSWNLDALPVGDEWYPAHHDRHVPPPDPLA